MKIILLITGGVMNLLLAVFHMFFWSIFNWKDELIKVSRDTAGILQIANLILIFIILYFSVMTYFIIKKEISDFHAVSFFSLLAGFYLIRIVSGYPLFGFSAIEVFVSVYCITVIACYIPVLPAKK
jgi:hypothetical protein